MITKFDSTYAGHIDLEDVGYAGTPVNDRFYPNEKLVTALHKAEVTAQALDRLGYNAFWMAEHHFQPEGTECIPNVLMMAFHLSHITKNIKLGCGFNITPMWHPLRLAEDYAMADILSKGRVVFGVGRGYHTREVETFGAPLLDQEANRELFEEQVDIIFKSFNNERFSHKGKHYTLPPEVPYRGYTLIGGPRKAEQFVTRDDVFDCVTYCEAVLAAAMARTPAGYKDTLRQIRYRDGAVAWRERNHYFSQWCARNIANNLCRPVAVPGVAAIDKTLTWMPELGAARMSIAAVPRASLLANKELLVTGDIIGFLSQRPRLDYFHIGFVVVAPDGVLWLRHAAKSRRRVLDEPLVRFLNVNRVKAVTVLRPRGPEAATS